MKNDNPCAYSIDEYGDCGRPKDHIVHSLLGISPREHLYKRPQTGNMRKMTLTPENVQDVADASGKTVDELNVILAVGHFKNQNIQVQFEVPDGD